ncbi:hypothetical protein ACFL1A_02010 [Patescibacteria group bacterium]
MKYIIIRLLVIILAIALLLGVIVTHDKAMNTNLPNTYSSWSNVLRVCLLGVIIWLDKTSNKYKISRSIILFVALAAIVYYVAFSLYIFNFGIQQYIFDAFFVEWSIPAGFIIIGITWYIDKIREPTTV